MKVSEEFNRILTPDLEYVIVRCYDRKQLAGDRVLRVFKDLPRCATDPKNPEYQRLLDRYTRMFEDYYLRVLKEME